MKDKMREFQEIINYRFQDETLLIQALTTPQLGNEIGKASYEFLETLGDAVIKVIFILKLYQMNINDPGEITKIKAGLEMNKALKQVANKINLSQFIFKTETQKVKGTRIMADVFEAICGAIFLDAHHDFTLVAEKMIDPFYEDFDLIIKSSIISEKNELLEFLQEQYKKPISIRLEYEKSGFDHDPIWIAKNPKIVDNQNQKELVKLSRSLKSGKFKNKKETEKDLYSKILEYLQNKNKKLRNR
ncbi:MAG: ribonuclease III domain-containing protein [Promethearchaeota archaeon]